MPTRKDRFKPGMTVEQVKALRTLPPKVAPKNQPPPKTGGYFKRFLAGWKKK